MPAKLTGFVEWAETDIPVVRSVVEATKGASLKLGQKGLLGQVFHVDLDDDSVKEDFVRELARVCLPVDAHWAVATLQDGEVQADVYEGQYLSYLGL